MARRRTRSSAAAGRGRFFLANRSVCVISRLVTVSPTPAAPGPDLAARFAVIIEALIEDIARAAGSRWGLTPLLLLLVRPYLRGIAKDFAAVVATARRAATDQPDPGRDEAVPLSATNPLVQRPSRGRTPRHRTPSGKALQDSPPPDLERTDQCDPSSARRTVPDILSVDAPATWKDSQGRYPMARLHRDQWPPIRLDDFTGACGTPKATHA